MSKECTEAKIWLVQCVMDMQAKLGLSPLEVAYLLTTQLRQVIDGVLFEEGYFED